MPGEQEPPPYEVLAALVASLHRELAEMAGALAQARTELAGAGSGSPRSSSTCTPRSSYLGTAPRMRWPSWPASHCPLGQSRR
jgi:hypothetical protein